jgi:electron transfer flavoprotein alpha/beta subunit
MIKTPKKINLKKKINFLKKHFKNLKKHDLNMKASEAKSNTKTKKFFQSFEV